MELWYEHNKYVRKSLAIRTGQLVDSALLKMQKCFKVICEELLKFPSGKKYRISIGLCI